MIISESKLDELLHHWRREYGPGSLFPCGTGANTTLQRLIDHQGFLPNSAGFKPVPMRTQADEVDAAVTKLLLTHGEPSRPNQYFRAGQVLKCEYLTPFDWSLEDRLRALDRIGMSMSASTYRNALEFGRAFLAGMLFQLSRKAS